MRERERERERERGRICLGLVMNEPICKAKGLSFEGILFVPGERISSLMGGEIFG
jgi:hypothetical protein